MKSILILLPIAATVVATALEQSAEDPILGVSTIHGCYSSVGELQLNGTNEFNSQGLCAANCEDTGAYVAAAQGDACYCGNKYPPASTLVDDSQCDEPCPGFGMDACGGSKAFTIINTGVMSKVDDSTDDSSGSEVIKSASTKHYRVNLAHALTRPPHHHQRPLLLVPLPLWPRLHQQVQEPQSRMHLRDPARLLPPHPLAVLR